MALALALTLDSGIELSTAYAKIAQLTVTPAVMSIMVLWYADVSAREAEKNYVQTEMITVQTPGEISFAAAYDALKTLPQFAGATDC